MQQAESLCSFHSYSKLADVDTLVFQNVHDVFRVSCGRCVVEDGEEYFKESAQNLGSTWIQLLNSRGKTRGRSLVSSVIFVFCRSRDPRLPDGANRAHFVAHSK